MKRPGLHLISSRGAVVCVLALSALAGSATSVWAQDKQLSSGELDALLRERERRAADEERGRARRLVQDFAASVDVTAALLARLETKATAFTDRMKAALTDDNGKRIASDPKAFNVFTRIHEDPAVTVEQVSARRKALESIRKGVQDELAKPNVGYVLSESTRDERGQIHYWSQERFARLSEQDAWFESAVAKAPKDIDLKQAKTLGSMIEAYNARYLELWAQAKTKAREESQQLLAEHAAQAELERGRAEAEKLLREAMAQIQTMKLEYELQLKQRELDDKKREMETETRIRDLTAELERAQKIADANRAKKNIEAEVAADITTSEAERLRLRHKCKDPEVTSLLAPFLADGYWQPAGPTIHKIPVSFSQLRACGALAPNASGLQKLLACGTRPVGSNKNLDQVRPRWGYNNRLSKVKQPEELEELKKAQAYLNELGETMVELKMLSP